MFYVFNSFMSSVKTQLADLLNPLNSDAGNNYVKEINLDECHVLMSVYTYVLSASAHYTPYIGL